MSQNLLLSTRKTGWVPKGSRYNKANILIASGSQETLWFKQQDHGLLPKGNVLGSCLIVLLVLNNRKQGLRFCVTGRNSHRANFDSKSGRKQFNDAGSSLPVATHIFVLNLARMDNADLRQKRWTLFDVGGRSNKQPKQKNIWADQYVANSKLCQLCNFNSGCKATSNGRSSQSWCTMKWKSKKKSLLPAAQSDFSPGSVYFQSNSWSPKQSILHYMLSSPSKRTLQIAQENILGSTGSISTL